MQTSPPHRRNDDNKKSTKSMDDRLQMAPNISTGLSNNSTGSKEK
jgi:hypothetical protein